MWSAFGTVEMEETDEASLFETGILVGGLIPRAAIRRFEFDFVFAD